jgi:dipeptidyl aminopeptidase/acylaminoacyl peptidase
VEEALPTIKLIVFLSSLSLLSALPPAYGQKPLLSLDDFFDSVDIRAIQISPDGHDVIIETVRADWPSNSFRNDLWLYHDMDGGSLVLITQSGHDSGAQWSPDGHSIAFLSDRKVADAKSKVPNHREKEGIENAVAQVYVVSARGGEALPVSFSDADVHSFAWSADSHRIYFATGNRWTEKQEDEHRKEWGDVVQFRESERGDTVFGIEVAFAAPHTIASESRLARPEPATIATIPYRIDQMAASPDGHRLAFTTSSRSGRIESSVPYGIYVIDLPNGGAPRLVLHTAGPPDYWASAYDAWSLDSRQIFFSYGFGTPEGPIEFAQNRLYTVSVPEGKSIRWASEFGGNLEGYAVAPGGSLIWAARLGTEVKPYIVLNAKSGVSQRPSWSGSYEHFSAGQHSLRVAFVFSSIQQPTEVYLADGPDELEHAHPVTAFNKRFTERELPKGKPYHWKTDDGVEIEGMLIYPPGQFEAKRLPMLTLIHGGPQEADGNHFEADWYQWSALAATQGWLVFQPNYRGSVGYGDAFTLGLVPKVGSRPGSDVLQGIDALVEEGAADPERLTIGGYSYGGYLTNWLITQTTRFKAAVTGAGDAEFVVNWGNNKFPLPYAYSLGGLPWEAEPNYNAQAPIWQIGKVITPTHIVAGADDITVYVGEDYLVERALTARGIPNTLLIFPSEGHLLDANPWHGKIKVREELKWLEKYGGRSTQR